jgi:putative restriction endonuclease
VFDRAHDAKVRAAGFDWLTEQVMKYGDVLPRSVLAHGYTFNGDRVPLVGPQGIFKPRILQVPISITTVPKGPYDDSYSGDRLLHYRYRGKDPNHIDNRGLRAAMEQRIPLVYFHCLASGKYFTTWPVFVVHDEPAKLTFSIAVDDAAHIGIRPEPRGYDLKVEDDVESGRRLYVTSTMRIRLHQRAFRERVLEAYRRQCAFCRLRHEELLDAAHIIPDSAPEGEPVVTNGLALCNLHHSAFDRFFIGVRPDYVIEIRPDILEEGDGPTLRYAIQGLHGQRIVLPARAVHRPDPTLLARRYEQYRENAVT